MISLPRIKADPDQLKLTSKPISADLDQLSGERERERISADLDQLKFRFPFSIPADLDQLKFIQAIRKLIQISLNSRTAGRGFHA